MKTACRRILLRQHNGICVYTFTVGQRRVEEQEWIKVRLEMRLRKDLFQYNSHNVMLLPCIIVAYRFYRIKPFLSVLQAPLEFIQIAVFETVQ